MSGLTLACAIIVGLLLAYGWGYRSGVAYCVREMKPLGKMAKDMADAIAERRRE